MPAENVSLRLAVARGAPVPPKPIRSQTFKGLAQGDSAEVDEFLQLAGVQNS